MGRRHLIAAAILLIVGGGCATDAQRLDAIDARLAAIEATLAPTAPPAAPGELVEAARVARERRDLIVTNLANVETIAFKRREAGRIDLLQGPLESTDRQLDVAINGTGFFRVSTPHGVAYTRNGNLFRNDTGELVIGSREGHRLTPTIWLPANAVDVSIAEDGTVEIVVADGRATIVDRLELVRFADAESLKPIDRHFFAETPASGPPIAGRPKEGGFGAIQQSFLEASNVEPVSERVRLTDAERSVELNERTLARYEAAPAVTTSPARPAR